MDQVLCAANIAVVIGLYDLLQFGNDRQDPVSPLLQRVDYRLLAPGDFRQKVPGDFRHFAPEEFSQF